ncbi:MAG: DNA polymerase III subunit epsilon [Rickettsiaceae bacterium]|nr:DNA polymerase III subunit epsilon [Rickettsiaceae bacterium]
MSKIEIILDTETTGLDPKSGHRIIEIGMLKMYDKVLTGEKFHFYINPQRDVPMDAYKIHGISTEFLLDKPLFKSVADEFLEFLSEGNLVIHNAPFDMKFINHELSLIGKPSIDMSRVIDTLPMARRKFPGAKVNLDALCKRFKVDNSGRNFHGALLDAKLLSEIYVELIGGRQATFSISASEDKATNDLASKGGYIEVNTKVVLPTKEELETHKELVKKISKPLWEYN